MPKDLTFFLWGDTHYGYDQSIGDDDLRGRIISQMKALPRWPYPEAIGGAVGDPEFAVLCGDAVDGAPGQGEAELAYFRYFTKQLSTGLASAGHPGFHQVEVMGNHDVDPAFAGYFTDRYGGLSHSFDCQGIHFICLNSLYDPGEPGHFGPDELAFLRADLEAAGRDAPVVLFVHSRIDRAPNGAEALALLSGHNVLLIASAHIHKPAVFQLEGVDCIDIGQCRDHPIDAPYGRSFAVVHITDDRLTAVPWRWDFSDWERGQRWADPEATARRFTLDKSL